MKADYELKKLVKAITLIRRYDGVFSILLKLKMIEELNMQIRNEIIRRNTVMGEG